MLHTTTLVPLRIRRSLLLASILCSLSVLRAAEPVDLMWEADEPAAGAGVASTTSNTGHGSIEADLASLRARLEAVEQENRALSHRLLTTTDGTAGLAAPTAAGSIQQAGAYDEFSSNAVDYSAGTPVAGPCFDCAPPDPLSMSAKWNNGLELQTADKKFRVKIGGRTQFDAVWFANSEAFDGTGGAEDADAVDFRRARLRAEGTMYEIVDWAAEYDFANSSNDNAGLQPAGESNVTAVTAITDLWLNISQTPLVGNIRIGHFKEPIGMEHLTSSRYLEFLERSFNQDAFTGAFNNGFSPGIMIWNTYAEQQGVWATGFFKNSTNVFGYDTGDGEYAWTSRLTNLPWYEDEGAKLVHVGVSGSIRDPNNGSVRYRTRPSLRNGPGALNPVLADTGNFPAATESLLGFEAAMNYGPLCIQSEYMGALNDDSFTTAGDPAGNTYVDGWYCEALYFLTGEHRPYDRKAGVFTRVVPRENFHWRGGCGAWQVGARYSSLDLRDGLIDGGILNDVTLGLNWYLNPNAKIQWNYAITDRNAPGSTGDGIIHGFGTRLAYDF